VGSWGGHGRGTLSSVALAPPIMAVRGARPGASAGIGAPGLAVGYPGSSPPVVFIAAAVYYYYLPPKLFFLPLKLLVFFPYGRLWMEPLLGLGLELGHNSHGCR